MNDGSPHENGSAQGGEGPSPTLQPIFLFADSQLLFFRDEEGPFLVRPIAWPTGRGLLLLTCGPFGNVVRMIPPLVVSGEQVVDGLEIWEKAVQQAVGD